MTKGNLKYHSVFNLAEAGASYFRQTKKLIRVFACLYVLLSFVLDLLETIHTKLHVCRSYQTKSSRSSEI